MNAYYDLGWGAKEVSRLLEMIHDYDMQHLKYLSKTDVDAVFLEDDWRSTTSLPTSLHMWCAYSKPLYRDYCEMTHAHGKAIFRYPDGQTLPLYEHPVETGVDAQLTALCHAH